MGILFERELALPAKGYCERITQTQVVGGCDDITLFEETMNPGCIYHWWLATSLDPAKNYEPSKDLQVQIFYDGESTPAIDVTLAQFYAVLLDRTAMDAKINCAALKALPKLAYNCYFPIPFKKITFTLKNNSPNPVSIWFMADWQRYENTTDISPYRFKIIHNYEALADPAGSYVMADISGSGFIAGIILGVKMIDTSDAWYHNGGDLWLIDGETRPRVIRGIGGEDIFNMSHGLYKVQTDWVGCPSLSDVSEHNDLGSGYDGIAYRIFGPDPVWFDTSIVIRFGTKANTYESIVYAYVASKCPEKINTPSHWLQLGPFECRNFQQFSRKEWPEEGPGKWKKECTPAFGQYLPPYHSQLKYQPFTLPIHQQSEHGWCDFAQNFRGRQRTNGGTQPVDVSAYAYGTFVITKKGKYLVSIGYDDWIRVWINGNVVHTGMNNSGLSVDEFTIELPEGESEIGVKLSNKNNVQWRLWAFCLNITAMA